LLLLHVIIVINISF